MRIILQDNIGERSFRIEPEQSELENLDEFQKLIKDKVSKALEVSDEIWKEHPEFKQIILDTTTDEERKMIAMAQRSNSKA